MADSPLKAYAKQLYAEAGPLAEPRRRQPPLDHAVGVLAGSIKIDLANLALAIEKQLEEKT